MSYRDGGGTSPEAVVVEMCLRAVDVQGASIRSDAMALKRLESAAEKAVVELQAMESTEVNLPFITATEKGPLHVQFTVRRQDLEGHGGPSGPVNDPRVKLG